MSRPIYLLAALYSAGKLTVNPIAKESNTIILNVKDPIPARGIDILTNIIKIYNLEDVQKKNIVAVNTILFIDKRLKAMEQDLIATESHIEAYKQNNATNGGGNEELNLTKSAEYKQSLEASAIEIRIVNSIQAYINITSKEFSIVPSSMGLKDAMLNTLINRFNDLQIERNRMLHDANLRNPLVQNLSDQIAALRVNINENLTNIKKGFIIERNHLLTNAAQYNLKVSSVPAFEKGLLERSREQSVKTSLYQYLLQKREETALSLSATVSASQTIDKPAYDAVPEYPKQQLSYLCCSILGLLLPTCFVYAQEHFNIKVKDSSGLSTIDGIKILGELSHKAVKSSIVMQKGSNTVISELFRYIRYNLEALNPNLEKKVILVTSGMQGEGKTFFSINLGLTLALLNKKVLLIEFDLRKPNLLKELGIAQKKGLTDYLQGNIEEVTSCIRPYVNASNLHVLGSGSFALDPAELLHNNRVDMLFDYLKHKFDYIIVDTSPVGQVADAFILNKYADASIYLVRYNYTSIQHLEILRDINYNKKLKNLMVVFNDAKKENRHAYAYGG